MLKRIVASLALVAACLGIQSARAAGPPAQPHSFVPATVSGHPGDYFFYAYSCSTDASGVETCAEEYVYSSVSTAVGPPTGGFLRCQSFGPTYHEIEVDFGDNSLGARNRTYGAAGVLPDNATTGLYSNLITGAGTAPYFAALSTSGRASGLVQASNATGALISGVINLTLRGGMFNEYETSEWVGPGTMSCSIKPSPFAFAVWSSGPGGPPLP